MKKITIRISDEEHKKLKAYCQQKEQSLNNVIRELIRNLKVAQNG
ncbi:MAG: DUF6290 family protein [Xenococcaceae cyanobacterium]